MLKSLFWFLVTKLYLIRGTTRKIYIGPYKGLNYKLTESLEGRYSIFYKYWEPEVSKVMKRIVKSNFSF